MDAAEKTMHENLKKNTGKSLDEWIKIVKAEKFEKHGQIIKYLKEKHAFTHGFANMVAHKSKGSDAGSVENKDDLLEDQYKGKEQLRPIYDKLMTEINHFGNDIEVAPKRAYVSLRRKKQFAMLQPASKSRFDLSLNIKNQKSQGKLEEITSANAMCTHKIKISSLSEIDKEILNWVKKAYDGAG